MSLIVCPECKNKISSASTQCINCGYPTGMIRKNQLIENIILEATIEQLNFSLRTYRILREAGIKTVSDIVDMDEAQLIRVWGMGKKSLDEIISRLSELGLSIHEDYSNISNTPKGKKATKLDWKCDRAPENVACSLVKYNFSSEELVFLKRGFLPQHMDHKWFCYYENGTVYFYRSWTGKLLFRLILNEATNEHILITHYKEEDELKDYCKTNIIDLIHSLIENR